MAQVSEIFKVGQESSEPKCPEVASEGFCFGERRLYTGSQARGGAKEF
jgi:hypothetical protein